MNRRSFIKLGSLASVPLILQSCHSKTSAGEQDFEIKVESLHTIGHKLTSGFDFSKYPKKQLKTEFLIVGGGVAGFSALTKLKGREAILVEASDKPGGTSSYATYKDIIFSQGAHYDIEYPNYYGEEVLMLLEELKVVQFDDILNKWEFVEKEYIIPTEKESITYFKDQIVEDPLNISEREKAFVDVIRPYLGKLPLPTRLISKDLHHLNSINFRDFLASTKLNDDLLDRSLDYQFIDDYGAGMNEVSALAGLHYFACRPYFSENPLTFSPPEGNYYFIRKMLQHNHEKEVLLNSFVFQIKKNDDEYVTSVWNEEEQQVYEIKSKKIIYSGKKHALKFIYPDLKFENDIAYAPWLVMNFILPNIGFKFGDKHWQNDVIGEKDFMGFVDSRVQFDVDSNYRNLTAYYCFKPEERAYLLDVFKDPSNLVQNAKSIIEKYVNIRLDPIQEVRIKLMGHAMPIPKKNYLLKDMNATSSDPDFLFAGVDNHRLPLLFDAMDSGLNCLTDS